MSDSERVELGHPPIEIFMDIEELGRHYGDRSNLAGLMATLTAHVERLQSENEKLTYDLAKAEEQLAQEKKESIEFVQIAREALKERIRLQGELEVLRGKTNEI